MSRAELRELAPAALVLPDTLLDILEDTYASPPRAYHSLAHVVEVAKEHARVARDVGWRDAAATYCAVLFCFSVGRSGVVKVLTDAGTGRSNDRRRGS